MNGARVETDAGFVRHALALLAGLSDYLKARLELAGLEAKEAGLHYVIILALLVGALVVAIFGYFFFCLALVFLIAWLFGDGHAWIWVTFVFALLHFAAGAGCIFLAKGRFAEPMFAVTIDEFKKDKEWLSSTRARQH